MQHREPRNRFCLATDSNSTLGQVAGLVGGVDDALSGLFYTV